MSGKTLTRIFILIALLVVAAVIHPAAPFLLLVPILALGAIWWCGKVESG